MTRVLVLLYLAAIVAANLSATHFGPQATVWNAFLFIGLDLTTRDKLHDVWKSHRWLKIGALVGAGSLLSYLVNQNSGRIAIASLVAFALAGTADALVYHHLRRREWFERANGSNVFGAAVDSLVFPTLAFNALLWPIVLGQFTAKVAGGLIWSFALKTVRARRTAVAT